MGKTICFFSSDSRPQYKKDVFNAVCYPDGFVIQFRYKKKYLQPGIADNFDNLTGKDGIIFFSQALNQETGVLKSPTNNISIRRVKIKKTRFYESTGLYQFFLELQEFKDYSIDQEKFGTELPPNYFVSEIDLIAGTENAFFERVQKIKASFQNELFTKVDLIDRKCNNIIYPSFEEAENIATFNLKDETEYSLKIDFIHTSDIIHSDSGKVPVLLIEDKTEQVFIHSEEYIDIGANADNRYFKMITKSISSMRDSSYLNFRVGELDRASGKIERTLQEFSLPVRISKRFSSILLFGILSTMAVAALAFLALFQGSIKDNNINYWFLVFAIMFAFFSSSLLYNMFNKK